MSERPPVLVKAIRRIDKKPERIYDAFMDPKLAGKFMFATKTGKMIRAEVDPQVGGGFVFTDQRPNGEIEHNGKFIELVRPKRIAFRFSVDQFKTEGDLVTIDISVKGKGSEVVLTHHVQAQFGQYKDKIVEGWTTILAGLAETA